MLIQYINKLRECRCHIHTLLVFDALETLTENLLHDDCIFLDILVVWIEIQEQCHEWRLSIGCHQCIDLVLDCLDTGTKLVLQAVLCHLLQDCIVNLISEFLNQFVLIFVVALAQIFAEMTDIYRLSAVLAAGNRGNNLCHNRTGYLKALWTLNQFSVHYSSIIKHIADIDQTAVEDRL